MKRLKLKQNLDIDLIYPLLLISFHQGIKNDNANKIY